MPRYYCDYCDTYLTHDSPSVRKQHNAGYKHKANVRSYYQQFEEQQTQSLIDQRIKEHLGQTAAYQQVGAAYNQHLASLQGQRPRLPVLPTPVMPMTGTAPANAPLIPGIRPPILPRPVTGAPGYGPAPNMPSMMGPPSMQINGLPRPPTMNPPTTVPGSMVTPTSNGSLSLTTPTSGGGFDSFNMNTASSLPRTAASGATAPSTAPNASQDGFTYSQASESSH